MPLKEDVFTFGLDGNEFAAMHLEIQDRSRPKAEFVSAGKPVIGICNGFQALVKSGILPFSSPTVPAGLSSFATLTFNQCGHFECRWVTLKPVSQACIWTRGLDELVDCPVAHGEGNFVARDPSVLAELRASDQVALTYVCRDGSPANGAYPVNPNGSLLDLAGVCNPAGNVLGLMPHPEDNVSPFQHPNWGRGVHNAPNSGLPLFQNGVRYAQGI